LALSLSDFHSRPATTTDWVIPNFLTRQNTGFILGPPKKACKSWLLLAMAWDLAEGHAVWGMPTLAPTRALRTVYFTQEDAEEDIDLRIKAHFSGGRTPNDRLWVVPKNLNIKLDTSDGRRLVERELDGVVAAAGAIDLVMFDPMRRIHNGNENDSETIAKMWDVIDRIHRRYGCSVIISHHITKPPNDKKGYDPTDPFNGRGSGDIYGGGDAFVMVVPGAMGKERLGRRVTAYFESKRAQELEPAHLDVNFKTGAVVMAPNLPLIYSPRGEYVHGGERSVDLR
jgi:RecA-family ATPase